MEPQNLIISLIFRVEKMKHIKHFTVSLVTLVFLLSGVSGAYAESKKEKSGEKAVASSQKPLSKEDKALSVRKAKETLVKGESLKNTEKNTTLNGSQKAKAKNLKIEQQNEPQKQKNTSKDKINIAKDKITVKVKGMVCSFCAQGIEKKFKGFNEVKSIQVNLDNMEVSLEFQPSQSLTEKQIKKAVVDSGFAFVEIKK